MTSSTSLRVEMRSWGFYWMMNPIMDVNGLGEDIRYKLDEVPKTSPISIHLQNPQYALLLLQWHAFETHLSFPIPPFRYVDDQQHGSTVSESIHDRRHPTKDGIHPAQETSEVQKGLFNVQEKTHPLRRRLSTMSELRYPPKLM